jgi:hypothetical protein
VPGMPRAISRSDPVLAVRRGPDRGHETGRGGVETAGVGAGGVAGGRFCRGEGTERRGAGIVLDAGREGPGNGGGVSFRVGDFPFSGKVELREVVLS